MSNFASNAPAPDFSRQIGDTVSDLVLGLQRLAARRVATRAAVQANGVSKAAAPAEVFRGEAAIPTLATGFAFIAWRR